MKAKASTDRKTRQYLVIENLTDHQEYIPQLADLWFHQLGKPWGTSSNIQHAQERFIAHCNKEQLPLAYVAIYDDQPIGMACLRVTDGILPELTPWLGGLVVDPHYRGNKIGEKLISAVKNKARLLQYEQIYLLTFDKTLPNWYAKLGWEEIGKNQLNGHFVTVMQTKLV